MDMERSKARAAAPDGVAEPQGKEEIVGHSLLASLEGDSRRTLLDLGTVERWPRRYPIAAQGEPPRSFVLIGSGRVKVERKSGDRALSPRRGISLRAEMVGETRRRGAPLATENRRPSVDDVGGRCPSPSPRSAPSSPVMPRSAPGHGRGHAP